MIDLRWGDCRDALRDVPDNSIDCCVTDPPYELGFMGKAWDSSGIAFDIRVWAEVLRVLKPGGHLLAFGGTRTYHRMVCAIEDAGFDIRDQLAWLYGSGFPKSLDVSKAIDDRAGAVRDVIGHRNASGSACAGPPDDSGSHGWTGNLRSAVAMTDEAREWSGWGTALKPAQEPICLARKPIVGTVAANTLRHGTGGINVDACRIGHSDPLKTTERTAPRYSGRTMANGQVGGTQSAIASADPAGRWPANVLLDETAAALLDEQSGFLASGTSVRRNLGDDGADQQIDLAPRKQRGPDLPPRDGGGGASRFFYVAKVSKAEREAGLFTLPRVNAGELTGGRTEGSEGLASPRAGAGRTSGGRRNIHPTVKPLSLMRYLIRLVCPPDGIVLDPFMGSGSTGCAAVHEGKHFVGVELGAEHFNIADARIERSRWFVTSGYDESDDALEAEIVNADDDTDESE